MTGEELRRALERTNKDVQRLNAHLMRVCPGPNECQITTPPRRIRQSSKPLMNKLERAFFDFWTHTLDKKLYPQAMRFKLANGLWYKPDFICFLGEMVCAYEIKGPHAFRGGFENLKMAASAFPEIHWELVWKEHGAWQYQHVLP